ncbi:phage virion morphogenesis protein [Brucella anthropi]|uniref:phage virion morphogenesis protein n=1 Tax=Brucella anthropi TaxID=529 RepID=UPI00244CAFD4|nr:phage virion morphogenesis protein [Brucella anthropi]MDG9793783.1 phage virion morphogenesis protein [Brucella anthropi]MDH0583672.1 phage virion morphogenesis protein [Brucella anthropi]MDH0820190.1 phage virion morphogenesis protein [Brucella anthropi]MDH2087021.1 phage virion morphogenesis protein [Brucella anthropi]
MSGVSLEVEISDKAVQQAFTRLITVMGDTTPIMSAIGSGLVGSTHRRFVSQKSPDGVAWKALNSEYKKTKRNSRILTESGRLRDSINHRAGRDQVTVGTNAKYAAVHQLGATIKPKSASHLVFRLASGIVLAKSVTIPARPYLGISDDDQVMISETVFSALQRRI